MGSPCSARAGNVLHHRLLMFGLLGLIRGASGFTLTHTSPTRVGPLGGGVVLLHGESLPYRDALLGQAFVLVGSEDCPILPHRSDPRGSFLACGPIPASNSTGAQQVGLVVADHDVTSCARCHLTFVPALRADASLLLSHRRGAAGDVVTLVGLGSWPQLQASHGLHEQMSAIIGSHDALPRHPGSTAVHLVGAVDADDDVSEGSWVVELALPAASAGEYPLSVAVDRLWHDETEVHGAVAIDGAAHATVTVLPAVDELHMLSERRLRLRGTGFADDTSQAPVHVLVGSTPCTVLNTSLAEIVCEMVHGLPPPAARAHAEEWGGGAPSAGPGLVLQERHLRMDLPECTHSLDAARDIERCAAAGGEAAVTLRQQLVFPHHTLERHDEETGGVHLHERHADHPHVLLRADGWLRPPVTGEYTFDVEQGDGGGDLLCDMRLEAPQAAGIGAGVEGVQGSGPCSSGAVTLEYGVRYRFRLDVVLSGHQQMVVRALVVPAASVAQQRASDAPLPSHLRFPAAPAEWFEQAQTSSADRPHPTFVNVQVNGLSALCRTAGGCTYEAAKMAARRYEAAAAAARAGWTVAFDKPVPKDEETPATQPSTMPLLPTLEAAVTGVDAADARRRLQSVCGPQSCCTVLFRGAAGQKCDPVPVWDFSDWVHPGGGFVNLASHRLCNSVRYSWLGRSGQHALGADPEDVSLATLSGGALKVGEFVDPVCAASNSTDVANLYSNLTLIEQRWSVLSATVASSTTDDVTVPRGAIWVLDANMSVRSLTIRGTLRWETTVDGLELSSGYVLVERGGAFELGTLDAPMLLRATIRIRNNTGHTPHPYLGTRFIAIDGLAASALDPTLLGGSAGQPMERIQVTLSSDQEPGQTIQVEHGGQVSELCHTCARTRTRIFAARAAPALALS